MQNQTNWFSFSDREASCQHNLYAWTDAHLGMQSLLTCLRWWRSGRKQIMPFLFFCSFFVFCLCLGSCDKGLWSWRKLSVWDYSCNHFSLLMPVGCRLAWVTLQNEQRAKEASAPCEIPFVERYGASLRHWLFNVALICSSLCLHPCQMTMMGLIVIQ